MIIWLGLAWLALGDMSGSGAVMMNGTWERVFGSEEGKSKLSKKNLSVPKALPSLPPISYHPSPAQTKGQSANAIEA